MSSSPPLRSDLTAAHERLLQSWARPGAWWTGEERLAIVREARAACRHDPLPPWQSPATLPGLTVSHDLLPRPALDAIWRIMQSPGSLTREWYTAVLEQGLTPEQYVELASLVATVACLDYFYHSLSLPLPPLPDPSPGAPSRERPKATVTTHWVPTRDMRGANVLKALSLLPDEEAEVREELFAAHYLPPGALLGDYSYRRGDLDRMQIELVASRTSLANDCFY